MHRRTMPFAVAALLGAPIVARAQKTPPESAPAAAPVAGLVEHRDPSGFVLHRPPDWRVVAPAPQEIMVIAPDQRALVLIRARLAQGDLAQWLTRGWPGTEADIAVSEPLAAETIAADVARAVLRVTDRAGIVRRVSAIAVRRGDLATVFVAAAPEELFGRDIALLSAILDSFRLGGGEAAAAAPASLPAMARWTEPNENAFSIAVPQGWQVQGGLMRRGPGGPTRTAVMIGTPDRRVLVFLGDQQPARFVLPSQTLLNLGLREGMPVQGTGDILMRFRHAGDIGPELLQRRFGTLQVTGRRELREIAAQRQQAQQQVQTGSVAMVTAAEIEFRLGDGRVGAANFITEGYDVPNLGGGWSAEESFGFVAAPDAVPLAGAILARVVGSFAVNPAWFVAETRGARIDADRQLAYLRERASAQQRQLEQRWAAVDQRGAAQRDLLGGTTRLVDPRTGEEFTVPNNSRFYYRNADPMRPDIAGTNIDQRPLPPLDFRRLLQMGTDIPYR